ncbi:MAG: enoyl-CoA hydratase/isomerase family protein [Myxococcota bacterium]|nr:enoyl-CoA hydratase/isomerase family protein [Myxococcota bacterium]
MAIHVDIQSGVGVLTLDRPERAHAYDQEHITALEKGFDELASSVPVVVIRSTGDRAFCGGADLDAVSGADPLSALDLPSQRLFNRIARSAAISIAAIQGPAVAGGAELTLACDLRVMGPQAQLRLPEVSHGLIPSAGGCTRLTRLAGPAIAKQIILFGETLSADALIRCGLGVPGEPTPFDAAMHIAQRFLKTADPLAARLAKQIIDRGEDPTSLEAERISESLLYHRRAASRP